MLPFPYLRLFRRWTDAYKWWVGISLFRNALSATIVAVKQIDMPALLFVLGVATLLFGGRNLRELAASLAEGLSNFRGGPGSPSHPLPADDSKILNRRHEPSKNAEDGRSH